MTTTNDRARRPVTEGGEQHVPHVVVIGAGFGGVHAVRALRHAPVAVTLIDRHNFQTFQPLLYQVATAGLNAADVAFPIRGAIRRYGNCRFHHGDVVRIDHTDRLIHLADGDTIGFDYLIVAAGARAAYFDVPGAEAHAFALYSLADATRLRNHILGCIEAADAHPDRIEDGLLTFVVVGAGPTGVEMAGALFEVCEGIVRKDFPRLSGETARVVLIEMRDAVLPALHETSQQYALTALRARGVDVRFGATVAGVEHDQLLLQDGARIATSTVIWAAGVRSEALAELLDSPTSRSGRVKVRADLSLTGHPDTFVIGDMADIAAPDGSSHPQVAQVALQSGQHAARQVVRRINGQAPEPFVYNDRGSMATIGRRAAVAELPSGLRIRGGLGWLAWLLLHLLYLAGFRNRMSVLLNWTWSYVTHERGPRLIFGSDGTRLAAHDVARPTTRRGHRRRTPVGRADHGGS
ncbi:MAG: NAD(P)/FAD-dependent oxidoreductase [Nocardioides sp.]